MSIKSICKEKNDTRNMNYTMPTLTGAIAGYSLKWALPLTQREQDENFKAECKEIRKLARIARDNEIKLIKSEINTTPGADKFIRIYNKGITKLHKEIKRAKKPLKDNLKNILIRISHAKSEANSIGRDKLIAYTKKIRPTPAFIAIGAAIGLLFPLVHNISLRKKFKQITNI